jgi:hypothetical protein
MKEAQSSVLKYGNKVYVYIPLLISSDSAFPFEKGEKVNIKIVDNGLKVEKI